MRCSWLLEREKTKKQTNKKKDSYREHLDLDHSTVKIIHLFKDFQGYSAELLQLEKVRWILASSLYIIL